MSYILEALKKSDAERLQSHQPRGDDPTPDPQAHFQAASAPSSSHTRRPMLLIGLLVGSVLVGGVLTVSSLGVLPGFPELVFNAPPSPVPEPTPQFTPPTPVPPPAQNRPAPKAPLPEAPLPEAPIPQAPLPEARAAKEKAPPTAQTAPKLVAKPIAKPAPPPVEQPAPSPPHLHQEAARPASTPAPAPVSITDTAAQETAQTLIDQAWVAIDKGFYNQALRDLNRAVALVPNAAEAWFARGWSNEKSGNELSAIGDYARAIAAKPNYAFALFSRGYLNLYIGNPSAAVTDFVRTQGAAQDSSLRLYSHLWLYLSRTRAGREAKARLAEDTRGEDLSPWPGPLVGYFLGQTDENRVLTAIASGPAQTRDERRSTGYFFLGIQALINGDQNRARRYFEKTLATGAVQFRQYDAAKRELDRLNR